MPIEASWSRCRCSTVCLKAKGHQLASSPAARRCTRVCAWMIPNSDSHRPLPADSSPAVLVCRMSPCVPQSRSFTCELSCPVAMKPPHRQLKGPQLHVHLLHCSNYLFGMPALHWHRKGEVADFHILKFGHLFFPELILHVPPADLCCC